MILFFYVIRYDLSKSKRYISLTLKVENMKLPIFDAMEQLLKQIGEMKQEVSVAVASDTQALEKFRIKYLGTKGVLKAIMGEMKNVPNEHKREFGQVLNEFKIFVETKFENLKLSLNQSDQASNSTMDFSMPGDELPLGSRHPISIVKNMKRQMQL